MVAETRVRFSVWSEYFLSCGATIDGRFGFPTVVTSWWLEGVAETLDDVRGWQSGCKPGEAMYYHTSVSYMSTLSRRKDKRTTVDYKDSFFL